MRSRSESRHAAEGSRRSPRPPRFVQRGSRLAISDPSTRRAPTSGSAVPAWKCDVIGVDLQGHGRTPLGTRPLRCEAIADDLDALLASLGHAQVDLPTRGRRGGSAAALPGREPQSSSRSPRGSACAWGWRCRGGTRGRRREPRSRHRSSRRSFARLVQGVFCSLREPDRQRSSSMRCTGPSLRISPLPTARSRFKKAYFGAAVSKRGSVRK